MPKKNWLAVSMGRLGLAVASLGLVYIFASLAVDSGSYWHYLGAIIFLILAARLLVRSFKK